MAHGLWELKTLHIRPGTNVTTERTNWEQREPAEGPGGKCVTEKNQNSSKQRCLGWLQQIGLIRFLVSAAAHGGIQPQPAVTTLPLSLTI